MLNYHSLNMFRNSFLVFKFEKIVINGIRVFYNAEDVNQSILIVITQKIVQMNDFPVIGMIGT